RRRHTRFSRDWSSDVCSSDLAGLVSCVTFVWLSAPDLALTQLLVEIVTTVLLLLSLRWLPERMPEVWPDKRPPFSVLVRRGSDRSEERRVGKEGSARGARAVG